MSLAGVAGVGGGIFMAAGESTELVVYLYLGGMASAGGEAGGSAHRCL